MSRHQISYSQLGLPEQSYSYSRLIPSHTTTTIMPPTTRSKSSGKGAPNGRHAAAHTPEYEFGGPIGTFTLLFVMPAVVYFLYFSCNATGCASVVPLWFPDSIKNLPTVDMLFSMKGTLIFLGWFAFQAVMYIALPGRWIDGVLLEDGTRLSYKMNGMRSNVRLGMRSLQYKCTTSNVD